MFADPYFREETQTNRLLSSEPVFPRPFLMVPNWQFIWTQVGASAVVSSLVELPTAG